MKTSAKTLAFATVASVMLLACDDTGTNVGSINCKTQPALTSVAEGGNGWWGGGFAVQLTCNSIYTALNPSNFMA